jgi:Resolvase, N terminal domain
VWSDGRTTVFLRHGNAGDADGDHHSGVGHIVQLPPPRRSGPDVLGFFASWSDGRWPVCATRERRPELDRLLEQVRPGDMLVVWRLDRLGRPLLHLIDVATELGGRGVGFRSLTANIDTTTAGGRLVFHVCGALAEFERELILERSKAGTTARARGRMGGSMSRGGNFESPRGDPAV